MTDVFLHVGAGKTGTSALQAALSRHRARLLEAGIAYPAGPASVEAMAARGEITSGNGVRLAWLTRPSRRPPDFDRAEAEQWLEQALDAAGSRPVLFSSEVLQLPDPVELEGLLAWFRARGRRVRVIYYVRHALDFAVAGYAQRLKVGQPMTETPSLAAFLSGFGIPFLQQLSAWEAAVGRENLTCRLYDRERADLLGSLLRIISTDAAAALAGATLSDVVNRSPTAIELRLFEMLNQRPGARELCRLATGAMLNAPPAVPSQLRVPEPVLAALASAKARGVRMSNAESIAEINARHFGGEPALQLSSGRIPIGPQPEFDMADVFATFVACFEGVARRMQADQAQPREAPPARQPPGVVARAHAAAGRLEEALAVLDQALERSPDNENLRRLHRRLAQQG